MSKPIDLPANSGLIEASIDEVDQMLNTPGVQIILPNASPEGDVVYEVQDDGSPKKINAENGEGL